MSAEKEPLRRSSDHSQCESQMPGRMRLNTDEVRILQECNRESFYYRSVPLAITAIAATHLAVHRGLLKPHPRWGSALKLLGAGFVGWFVGKISYRSACEEKFLHLRNSPLADLIRKKKGYIGDLDSDISPPTDPLMLLADVAPTFSIDDDYTSSSHSLNLDTNKNVQYSGLENRSQRSDYGTQPQDKTSKFSTSYDELRKQNREEFELRQSKQSQQSSMPSSVPPLTSSPRDWRKLEDKPQTRQSYRTEGSGTENAYGDRWDK